MRKPRLAESLLRGFMADPDLEDAVLGDLAREWSERVESDGLPSATAWYWGQVLRSAPHFLHERWIRQTREETMKTAVTPLRLAARPLVAAATLLTVPLVAMQFTAEVNWSPFDFAFMGALVFGIGFSFELALTKTDDAAYRVAAGVALAAAFLLVWAGAGVGIIGVDGDPANLMYGGVLAVGTIGAAASRFRSRGMARTMVAAALAQAAIAAIAIVAGLGRPYSGVVELVLANVFFVALFLGSASLFAKAARRGNTAGARATG